MAQVFRRLDRMAPRAARGFEHGDQLYASGSLAHHFPRAFYTAMPLFRRAGCAVAMDNAVPELKALAHALTASNEEDGVARFLRPWLAGGRRQPTRRPAGPALAPDHAGS